MVDVFRLHVLNHMALFAAVAAVDTLPDLGVVGATHLGQNLLLQNFSKTGQI